MTLNADLEPKTQQTILPFVISRVASSMILWPWNQSTYPHQLHQPQTNISALVIVFHHKCIWFISPLNFSTDILRCQFGDIFSFAHFSKVISALALSVFLTAWIFDNDVPVTLIDSTRCSPSCFGNLFEYFPFYFTTCSVIISLCVSQDFEC